jgi:hypothetical protein
MNDTNINKICKILVNLITLMDKEISLDQNQIVSVCIWVTT